MMRVGVNYRIVGEKLIVSITTLHRVVVMVSGIDRLLKGVSTVKAVKWKKFDVICFEAVLNEMAVQTKHDESNLDGWELQG